MTKTKPKRLFLFDLDGTIYLSGVIIDGVQRVLNRLDAAGVSYAFMTNNSVIGPKQYVAKLQGLGLHATEKNVLTSAEACVLMLQELDLGPRLYVLGTVALRQYLAQAGFEHVEQKPGAVLVGFDTELTYDDLTTAARLVADGVPLLASHADVYCPSSAGIMPDVGSILAALEAATGVSPLAIAGKPNRWMVQLALQRYQLQPEEICIVGDRLETDMKMAGEAGMQSILTLTGVTKRQDLAKTNIRVDLVVDSVARLAVDDMFDAIMAGGAPEG